MDLSKLKKVVDRNKENRSRASALEEFLYGRQKEIKVAPNVVMSEFWCDTCKRDFNGPGFKQIRVPKGALWFAYYVSACPCGRHAVRRITDKYLDPYYWKSEKIRREQGLFHDDMLHPLHPRFRVLYPKQYAKLMLLEQGVVT